MDYNLPDSSVHGISQARIHEWVAISFSRGSFWPRNWTRVSCTGRQILYHRATRGDLRKYLLIVQSLSCVWPSACPSQSPGVCSYSCWLNQWRYLTISFSATPFIFSLNLSKHQSLLQWLGCQSIGASASASVLPMNISGLISFRIDWLDLLAVQRTLKSLLQHHNSKISILWCSTFLMDQHSQLYMTTGKNHSFDYMDLCRQSVIFAF